MNQTWPYPCSMTSEILSTSTLGVSGSAYQNKNLKSISHVPLYVWQVDDAVQLISWANFYLGPKCCSLKWDSPENPFLIPNLHSQRCNHGFLVVLEDSEVDIVCLLWCSLKLSVLLARDDVSCYFWPWIVACTKQKYPKMFTAILGKSLTFWIIFSTCSGHEF
jgi:hypothetical protein